MSKILIGYSPYRSVLKQERAHQVEGQTAVASSELVKLEISPMSLMVILFIITALLGSLYLLDFNKNATKGYILKRLDISQQELQDQNDLKNLALSRAKAMNQMIASGSMDHMHKPNEISYIFGDSVIAKAN